MEGIWIAIGVMIRLAFPAAAILSLSTLLRRWEAQRLGAVQR